MTTSRWATSLPDSKLVNDRDVILTNLGKQHFARRYCVSAPFEFGDCSISGAFGGGDFCAQHPTGSMTNLRSASHRSLRLSSALISTWAVPRCAFSGCGSVSLRDKQSSSFGFFGHPSFSWEGLFGWGRNRRDKRARWVSGYKCNKDSRNINRNMRESCLNVLSQVHELITCNCAVKKLTL